MDNFFASRPSQEELQRRHVQQRAQRRPQINTQTSQSSLHSAPISPMNSDTPMVGGDSLDDIIRDNNVEFHRHRSLSQSYNGQMSPHNGGRRLSMVEFGGNDDSFRDYQFGGMANPTADGLGTGFSNVGSSMMIPGTNDTFSPQAMLSDDFNTISPDMMGNMIALSNMNMGPLNASASSMNFFDTSGMPATFQPHPMGNMTPGDYNMQMDNEDSEMMNDTQGYSGGADRTQRQPGNLDTGVAYTQSMPPQVGLPAPTNFQAQIQPAPLSSGAVNATSAATAGPQPAAPKESKTIYSKSGFDMLRALWLVATRKGPQVNLGAVDMSCAFVVCDVSMNDCPIIYVSDNFQNLTGYSKHDIVGQNCRFLQAPDGKVEAGTKREFVDNGAVYNLKKKIAEGKEVQQSLINYRKGGKPFLNLLTMIPIPWDTPEIRYIIGFQIDLVECPDAIASGKESGSMTVNYKHSDIGQYIWQPPTAGQIEPENGQTLGADDVSTLLQQFTPKGAASDWHKQSWDKMLLENADDVVHVLSLKGLFLYLSPSCKRILEYDAADLVGTSISSICHPSDIVPVTRELKETTTGGPVSIVFRIRRKQSGYTWFESHGSLFVEQGKGRKCIILIGRKRPVLTLSRRDLESNSGIGDSELWTKLSTSGMFLFVSSNVRSLLDLQPDSLVGTSIQDLMRKESRPEFGRSIEKARRGRIVTCKHEVQNRRGQVLQAHTTLYPGDAIEGQKPTFLLAQTKLLKASSRAVAPAGSARSNSSLPSADDSKSLVKVQGSKTPEVSPPGIVSQPGSGASPVRSQDRAMLSDDNIFDELKTTRCTSWQYELRQMEKINRVLAEELHGLLSNKKKRKRRKGVGNVVRDCANCHTRNTPEWRRGPSGQRDLCNSCGLRWAKQTGRVSPRTSSRGGGNNGDAASKKSNSPVHSSPLQREVSQFENTDVQPSDTASSTTANRSSVSSGGPSVGSSGTTPLGGVKGPSVPPPSQPSLAGGVPAGSEMTAIQEEREASS